MKIVGGSLGKQTIANLAGTAIAQLSAIGGLLYAARALQIESFAAVSRIIALMMIFIALLEGGTNSAVTRRYLATRQLLTLRKAFGERLLTLGVSCALAVAWYAIAAGREMASGLIQAGLILLWNGLRNDQLAEGKLKSFVAASIIFAMIRTASLVIAIELKSDASGVVWALYGLPAIVIVMSWFLMSPRQRMPSISILTGEDRRFGILAYIAGILFIVYQYLPQYFYTRAGNPEGAAAYGLAMSLIAPIALVTQAARSAIFRSLIEDIGGTNGMKRLLWSNRSLRLLAAVAGIVCLIGLLGRPIVGIAFSAKVPGAVDAFSILFVSFGITAVLGILGTAATTSEQQMVSVAISLIRIAALFGVVLLIGSESRHFLTVYGSIMLIGEICFVSYLYTTG